MVARVDALATHRARQIAAERIQAHIPMEQRDPLERLVSSVWYELGLWGLIELFKTPFQRHVSSSLRVRFLELHRAYEASKGSQAEERSLYAAGLAAARSKAAKALSAALELIADPTSDLRSVLNELRAAVEMLREGQEIERADAHAERGEVPIPPRRRRIIDARRIRPRGRAA